MCVYEKQPLIGAVHELIVDFRDDILTIFPKFYWVVAKIRPDVLDREVWTKSGPSLDCVWTVFSKMVAEITMVCRGKST